MMSSLGACKKLSVKRKETAVLEREDFDAGPTNVDCIEPGLFIGMYFVRLLHYLNVCDPGYRRLGVFQQDMNVVLQRVILITLTAELFRGV